MYATPTPLRFRFFDSAAVFTEDAVLSPATTSPPQSWHALLRSDGQATDDGSTNARRFTVTSERGHAAGARGLVPLDPRRGEEGGVEVLPGRRQHVEPVVHALDVVEAEVHEQVVVLRRGAGVVRSPFGGHHHRRWVLERRERVQLRERVVVHDLRLRRARLAPRVRVRVRVGGGHVDGLLLGGRLLHLHLLPLVLLVVQAAQHPVIQLHKSRGNRVRNPFAGQNDLDRTRSPFNFSRIKFFLKKEPEKNRLTLSDPFLAAAARPASARRYSCMIQSVLTPRGALPA
jgi:hypothetical protein